MRKDWIWQGERRRGMRALLVVAAVAGMGYAALLTGWILSCAGDRCPDPGELERMPVRETSIIYAADGTPLARLGTERRVLVPLDSMAPLLRQAFIVTEDKRFYRHQGVDYVRAVGALGTNLAQGGFREGFSTLTMQLARTLWPGAIDRRERSITRKIREIQVAFGIEDRFSKRRILELYLNQVPLAPQVFGVEAAAREFFAKSASELNPAEAALLAALPKAPALYNPRRHPERALRRRNLVLDLLRREGVLSDAEAEVWKHQPLVLAPSRPASPEAPWFVDYVRLVVNRRFGDQLPYGGLRIYTTLDRRVQSVAESVLSRQLSRVEAGRYGTYRHTSYARYREKHEGAEPQDAAPYLQGAVVVIEARTGRILAMVGGRDYRDSKFNRAAQARRQAGSAFKPFVYAAAVRHGTPLSAVVYDDPITVPTDRDDESDWSPQNSDYEFQGAVTVRQALYLSRNAATVRLGLDVGLPAVIAEARRFGVGGELKPYPSLLLGAVDVSPLELTAAYSVFANGGVRTEPTPVLRVTDREGRVLWDPGVTRSRVMEEAEAWLLTVALRDVIRRGTAYSATTGAGFYLPAGGKTGTSDGYADAWFVGFTPDLVATVWTGLDKRETIFPGAQGGRVAAPAWTALMEGIYRERERPDEWLPPPGIITVAVDVSTGFLHSTFCPEEFRRYEPYLTGTQPRQFCPVHQERIEVDSLGN